MPGIGGSGVWILHKEREKREIDRERREKREIDRERREKREIHRRERYIERGDESYQLLDSKATTLLDVAAVELSSSDLENWLHCFLCSAL